MSSPSFQFRSMSEKEQNAILMGRCLQLAELGAGYTAPNPMVGAILVHEGRIIGEGYHQHHGGPHAEVNCLTSVKNEDRSLIPNSTLFVSLEPCVHHGKTPPCTDLILREKIKKVVIGCRDPFFEVNGKGIEKLLVHGVHVEFPFLEELSKEKNRRFFTFHQKRRPWIILKWAQSVNHKIADKSEIRTSISNDFSNRLVHKWRSEEAGILVGTNTALHDNPELTTRLWPGKNPVRIVIDKKLRLPDFLKIFDGGSQTIVLNESTDLSAGKILFKKMDFGKQGIPAVLSALHDLTILSVLVEGGARLLQSFIEAGIWDEIRVITNHAFTIPEGISAPYFKDARLVKSERFESDTITYYEKGTPV